MNMNDRFACTDLACMTCGATVTLDQDRERHNEFHNLLEQTALQVFCQDEYYSHYCNLPVRHEGDHMNLRPDGRRISWHW